MIDLADEIKVLSSKEYDAIGQAMFEKISVYEKLPDKAKLDYQSLDGTNHIGFLTKPGGKYTAQYVTGGFEAQLPFQICYKLMATGNQQYLDAENVVNGLADYLEENSSMNLTGGRIVTEIQMDSITYRSQADADGSVVFVRNGIVKYEKL